MIDLTFSMVKYEDCGLQLVRKQVWISPLGTEYLLGVTKLLNDPDAVEHLDIPGSWLSADLTRMMEKLTEPDGETCEYAESGSGFAAYLRSCAPNTPAAEFFSGIVDEVRNLLRDNEELPE